ncbi:hypothetical protein EVAR_90307_1 [Eumeta japonica]|uniref:Uncharacterized protein n=1 Tax=Eumeta variegata TaxID=151549 RepID=A0A4C1ZMP2_EUMVA|nr:hypothetical protein EVAR_90307_1 [Eumeta japonica]
MISSRISTPARLGECRKPQHEFNDRRACGPRAAPAGAAPLVTRAVCPRPLRCGALGGRRPPRPPGERYSTFFLADLESEFDVFYRRPAVRLYDLLYKACSGQTSGGTARASVKRALGVHVTGDASRRPPRRHLARPVIGHGSAGHRRTYPLLYLLSTRREHTPRMLGVFSSNELSKGLVDSE